MKALRTTRVAVVWAAVWAAATAPGAAVEEEPPARQVDVWHAWLSQGVTEFVDDLDRFFGDDRIEDDVSGTRVRLALGVDWNRAEGPSLLTRFRARLDLPKTVRRLQLIVDSFSETDELLERVPIDDALRESKPDTGVRYIFRDEGPVRLSADAGARLGGNPQTFGRLRARLVVPMDPWEFRLIQTAQWYSQDGLGLVTEGRWSRRLGDNWLFRVASRLGWYAERDGVTPSQSFTWLRVGRGGWGHRIAASAEWPDVPGGERASYRLVYGHRRRVFRDWLFIEAAPGVDFSEVRDYEPNPRMEVLFEALFGAGI